MRNPFILSVVLGATLVAGAAQAQQQASSPAPQMSAEQQAMMEAWKKAMTPGEPHQRLASRAGEWTFAMKMWMEPGAPATEATGTTTFTPILGGRFVQSEHKSQMMGMPFHGISIDGYDNVTGRYVASWVDNMSTGIMHMTGTYDPATKTYTYTGEMKDPMAPSQPPVKVRETITDKGPDEFLMEMYETREGKERKSMEAVYTRKKSAS